MLLALPVALVSVSDRRVGWASGARIAVFRRARWVPSWPCSPSVGRAACTSRLPSHPRNDGMGGNIARRAVTNDVAGHEHSRRRRHCQRVSGLFRLTISNRTILDELGRRFAGIAPAELLRWPGTWLVPSRTRRCGAHRSCLDRVRRHHLRQSPHCSRPYSRRSGDTTSAPIRTRGSNLRRRAGSASRSATWCSIGDPSRQHCRSDAASMLHQCGVHAAKSLHQVLAKTQHWWDGHLRQRPVNRTGPSPVREALCRQSMSSRSRGGSSATS